MTNHGPMRKHVILTEELDYALQTCQNCVCKYRHNFKIAYKLRLHMYIRVAYKISISNKNQYNTGTVERMTDQNQTT